MVEESKQLEKGVELFQQRNKMKNLITITLLFIAQLSFGQELTIDVVKPTDTLRWIRSTKEFTFKDSVYESYTEIRLTGETGIRFTDSTINVMVDNNLTIINDPTNQVRSIIDSVFIYQLVKTNNLLGETQRKLKFYEDSFGKINGSLDVECVELLPAIKPAQPCVKPKKKYNYNKRT